MYISVIIPVYNAENSIIEAVKSVLVLSEVAEIILVEDGSNDNSLAICYQLADIDNRIIVLYHTNNKNKGVAATRNLGLQKAKFDYVAFLDADDIYLSNRFASAIKILGSRNDIDGVYDNVGIYSNDEKDIRSYTINNNVKPHELFENLQPVGNSIWFHINGLTVRKKVFQRCGLFDESLKTSEDTFMWFKLAAKCKLISGFVEGFVSIKRRSPTSLTSNKVQVDKDYLLMLINLYKWCNIESVSRSRKEMVLNRLFYHVLYFPYKNFHGMNKFIIFIKIFLINPKFALFESQVFRRYLLKVIK
ncbi:glycosyltransferase family 2 protein [Pontibacter liquoris]|uniref:glycosyltransferase family 2 protein n=1 Tax=Pontibacter liquoris TaxID=2905677 RepID=UPI001FA6D29C|nr:glycosyltransferase family 2 protein [Pontibacter liquoris]